MDQKEIITSGPFTAKGLKENTGYIKPSEVHDLPDSPGVYLMKDKRGTVIYVGKANSLKKRVSSYFQKKTDTENNVKTRLLVENIHIIDYIKVANETEALILEANLIKEYQPRYNIDFKDNKFYPFVRVTAKDEFPRIVYTREQRKDGAKYFGPYTSSRAVRQYIDIVQRVFQLRTCVEMPKKECLNYHIKRCTGPCIGKISGEEYREQVRQAVELLSGGADALLEEMEKEMLKASRDQLYEKAQIFKEKIQAIRSFEDSQSVFLPKQIRADFIGLFTRMGLINFVVIIIRGGKMVGKRSYTASLQVEEDLADVLTSFILEYRKQSDRMQDTVYIAKEYEGIVAELNGYFRGIGDDVAIAVAREERHKALVRMAVENAALHMTQVLSKVEISESLQTLQEHLKLDTLPMRIEGFDIANILGTFPVASLVSFYAGKPDKGNYRRFRIKTKTQADDFAMIHEAVFRRYKRLKEEGKEFPDLVLIDGGKGQLNAALEALAELDLHLNVISLAKKNEEIYDPYHERPLVLPKNSPALHVLQQVRDETHRFANAYYNKIKGKGMLSSVFDHIEGIGEKRKKIIIQKLLNYDIIRDLKEEDLVKEGLPARTASAVLKEIRARFAVKKEKLKGDQ